MDLLELEQRAGEAYDLLNHPLLKGALDAMRQEALDTLVQSSEIDPLQLALVKAVDELRRRLQTHIDDPKMALHSIRTKRMTGGPHGRS